MDNVNELCSITAFFVTEKAEKAHFKEAHNLIVISNEMV